MKTPISDPALRDIYEMKELPAMAGELKNYIAGQLKAGGPGYRNAEQALAIASEKVRDKNLFKSNGFTGLFYTLLEKSGDEIDISQIKRVSNLFYQGAMVARVLENGVGAKGFFDLLDVYEKLPDDVIKGLQLEQLFEKANRGISDQDFDAEDAKRYPLIRWSGEKETGRSVEEIIGEDEPKYGDKCGVSDIDLEMIESMADDQFHTSERPFENEEDFKNFRRENTGHGYRKGEQTYIDTAIQLLLDYRMAKAGDELKKHGMTIGDLFKSREYRCMIIERFTDGITGSITRNNADALASFLRGNGLEGKPDHLRKAMITFAWDLQSKGDNLNSAAILDGARAIFGRESVGNDPLFEKYFGKAPKKQVPKVVAVGSEINPPENAAADKIPAIVPPKQMGIDREFKAGAYKALYGFDPLNAKNDVTKHLERWWNKDLGPESDDAYKDKFESGFNKFWDEWNDSYVTSELNIEKSEPEKDGKGVKP